MATHSSILARRIPGTEEPGGLPSMGSHRVGHNCSNLAAAAVDVCGVFFGFCIFVFIGVHLPLWEQTVKNKFFMVKNKFIRNVY